MLVRRFHWLFVLGILALVGSVVLSGCAPGIEAAQAPVAEGPARTITVVGRGEVKASPDIATTTVGVEVTASTVDAAMDEAEAHMKAILGALNELGIADKDVQTSNFSINFERDQSAISGPRPTESASGSTASGQPAGFYRVSNMVQVSVRELDKIGAVLEAAIEAGANNVWGIYFGLEDTKPLEAKAREAAVKDARERAEILAELNGVDLANVISVSEVVGNTPGPLYASEAAARGLGGGGATVVPGELTFSTQLQIVYGIR